MKKYLVTYDLIKHKDYPELLDAIRATYKGSWHCLKSVWIIKTNSPAIDIINLLGQHIDADDKMIVVELSEDIAWTDSFQKNCQDWLHKNF